MMICRSLAELQRTMADLRSKGSVGLVTTMGALHPGHMALVAAARADHEVVVATIFVNPSQFGDPADLEAYPRTEEADVEMLRAAGVTVVLIPQADEIYPDGEETIVETTRLANMLHGRVRPGHFRGVATVVAKFFNIIRPDAAYFGKKDYQQLAVIRKMTRDLHFPTQVCGVETVREGDGVAMSSRNIRLHPQDRAAAPILHQALCAAEARLLAGGTVQDAEAALRARVATEPRADLQGVHVVDAQTFSEVSDRPQHTVGIMVSALFGDVLLLDQKEVPL